MFTYFGHNKRLKFMDRGLISKARGFPTTGQHKVHETNKTPVVYDNENDLVNSLRVINGVPDRLVIAGPLHILGTSRKRIRDVVRRVKAKGCDVFDLVHGESTEGAGFEAFGRAYDFTNPAHNFKNASAAGKKGAEAKKKKHKPGGVGVAEGKCLWFDLNISTNREALARMCWSQSRAYDKFGKSGRTPGPRSETKKD